MILEGLVTTTSENGLPHVAPMGPRFAADMRSFELRPFPTSTTFSNLCSHPEGVLHVTDDVLLLARAAVGKLQSIPPIRPADEVRGFILNDACRYFEFRIVQINTTHTLTRMQLEAEVVRVGSQRDFFGFNRAKHAVLEAAILATRFHLLPAEEITQEFQKLRIIVDKTAGPQELEAMQFLESEWQQYRAGAAK